MKPASDPQQVAAGWVVRRDRGLSATEAIEYELWLASDERHPAAMRSAEASWACLDRLPDDIGRATLAAARRSRLVRRYLALAGAVAAAVALIFAGFTLLRPPANPSPALVALSAPRLLTLSDGTVVQLNTGGAIREEFTASERHVFLSRGEAHFEITKNPDRPFIVHVGRIAVRAVGTAFNVNLRAGAVEVLVTEGVVRLSANTATSTTSGEAGQSLRLLNSGHLATIDLQSSTPAPAVVVTALSADEISRSLAWRDSLVRLRGTTLAEIVATMSARTGRRIVLADPALGELRLGGRLSPDDLDSFAALIAATLDLEVESAPDGQLILRKKK